MHFSVKLSQVVLRFKYPRILLLSLFLLHLGILKTNYADNIENVTIWDCYYDSSEFEQMAKAIEEGLNFFEYHLSQVNLDTCLGAVVVQAQIHLALNSNRRLPSDIRSRLEVIERLADTVASKLVESVKANPAIPSFSKSNTLGWVTDKSLWMQPGIDEWKPFEVMTATERRNYTSEMDEFQGTKSDRCIKEVLSCSVNNITQDCQEYMLSKPRYLYSLNHQVIYMLIAKQRKCGEHAHFRASVLKQDPDLFLEELCSKVWFSARRVQEYNYFWGVRDLFTEQVGLCSLAGYPNFLHKDWLQMILSWQSKSGTGCFLDPITYATKRPLFTRNTTEVTGNRLEIPGSYPPRLRAKRSEVLIEAEKNERCLLHFTAVGIMAISIHLRHLIEICYVLYTTSQSTT